MPLPLKFWLARGAELTAKLRVHLGVLATLKGDDALPVTLALMDLVAKRPERLHDFMEAAVDKAERDPGFNELKADAYQPPPLDLEVLATFEHGTLGRTVALIPVLSSPGKSRNDPADTFGFLADRVRASAPAWRALLGEPDDLTFQGFLYAQTECPLPCLVIACRLYQLATLSPRALPGAASALSAGFAAGQRAAYLPGLRLEDEWGSELAALRVRLRLV